MAIMVTTVTYRYKLFVTSQIIVAQIRQTWPHVRIITRGDSGFCRDKS